MRAGGAAGSGLGRLAFDWRQTAWRGAVSGFDRLLRRWYGVYEFSTERDCVLRLGPGQSPRSLRLADGTRIERGAPVGILHFWNEHLPPFPPQGPNLRWAKQAQRCMERSLQALAGHIRQDPRWQPVQAFRAELSLSRGGRTEPLQQLTRRYGFEVVTLELSGLERCHALGEDLLQWSFTRAFNPVALRHRGLFRERRELWISRQVLLSSHAQVTMPARHHSAMPARLSPAN